MNREQVLDLLKEFVQSDSLMKHALSVEAGMRHYAVHFGQDAELWGLVGLIHDFDYERWPNPPDHTREGAKILRERGVSHAMQSVAVEMVDAVRESVIDNGFLTPNYPGRVLL